MIGDDLRSSRERGEPADILIAAEYPIYGRFGYGPATQRTDWELDATAATFVDAGAGSVEFIDNDTFRKEAPAIFERVRRGRPGMIGRDDLDWDFKADLRRRPEDKPWQGFRLLCRDDDGVAQGYASYTVKEHWSDFRPRATIELAELCAAEATAEARLWRLPRRARPRRHGQGAGSAARRAVAVAARQRAAGEADRLQRLRVGPPARRPGTAHGARLHDDRARRHRGHRRPGPGRRTLRPRRLARRRELRGDVGVRRPDDAGGNARCRVTRRPPRRHVAPRRMARRAHPGARPPSPTASSPAPSSPGATPGSDDTCARSAHTKSTRNLFQPSGSTPAACQSPSPPAPADQSGSCCSAQRLPSGSAK